MTTMLNLIEKGRHHRFLGSFVHILVFLLFYLLYLLIYATLGANNPFYPFDWAARRAFLYFWVPVLIVRLFNCNITASCMTLGYFLGLILSIPVGNLTYEVIYYHDGSGGFYVPNHYLMFWFCFVLIAIILGVILEVRYHHRITAHGTDTTLT